MATFVHPKSRNRALAVVLLMAAAVCACGESRDCINPHLVVSDGRIITSQFEASVNGVNPTYWYAFAAQSGHSYAVEFVPTSDNENTPSSLHFASLTIWGPSDIAALQQNGCRGATTLSSYSTQKYAPAIATGLYGTGQRVSFIQPASGINIVAISNTQAAGTYSYRITDTTLFNPRWSTFASFDTQWGLTNMSDMSVTGTLSIYDGNNKLIKSTQVTVPPTGQVFRLSNASDLNLPRDTAGSAVFAYNGPPRAILGDAYFINAAATVIVYAKFESRYSQ
jgi:hypothetical protein